MDNMSDKEAAEDNASTKSLDDHLKLIRTIILREAKASAQGKDVGLIDIAEATKRFAPGIELPEKEPLKKIWWRVVLDWTPSPILVSALLAVAFGVLGVYRGGQGAFDIAKVFAGAIVGSAAATAKSKIN